MRKLVFTIASLLAATGCTTLHSTQFGNIDSDAVARGRRFEILVSETGINLDEAAGVAKSLTRDQRTQEQIGAAQAIISLFEMGPRTGNPVLDEKYADIVFERLKTQCPSGRMTGLMSIRETAKYPVISGEIVRIVGYCTDT